MSDKTATKKKAPKKAPKTKKGKVVAAAPESDADADMPDEEWGGISDSETKTAEDVKVKKSTKADKKTKVDKKTKAENKAKTEEGADVEEDADAEEDASSETGDATEDKPKTEKKKKEKKPRKKKKEDKKPATSNPFDKLAETEPDLSEDEEDGTSSFLVCFLLIRANSRAQLISPNGKSLDSRRRFSVLFQKCRSRLRLPSNLLLSPRSLPGTTWLERPVLVLERPLPLESQS